MNLPAAGRQGPIRKIESRTVRPEAQRHIALASQRMPGDRVNLRAAQGPDAIAERDPDVPALVQTEPLSQETFSAVPVTVVVSDTSWSLSGEPSPATVELRLGGPARGGLVGLPVEVVDGFVRLR